MSDNIDNNDLIYQLPKETIFNGTSDCIDTGIKLYSVTDNFTIYFRGSWVYSEQIGTVNNQATLFTCMNESGIPYPGFAIRQTAGLKELNIIFGSSQQTSLLNNYEDSINNGQICLTVQNKRGQKVYYGDNHNNIKNFVPNDFGNLNNIEDAILVIGGYRMANGTYGRFFKCTIHDFKVYNRVLSDDEINDLFV